jgi:hypothetical protein
MGVGWGLAPALGCAPYPCDVIYMEFMQEFQMAFQMIKTICAHHFSRGQATL